MRSHLVRSRIRILKHEPASYELRSARRLQFRKPIDVDETLPKMDWNQLSERCEVVLEDLGQPPGKLAFVTNWWDNQGMKDHDAARHPGAWRVMRVDAESAGLLVAVGFLVLGFVSMPKIATWFLFGALVLGLVIALLLRFSRKG